MMAFHFRKRFADTKAVCGEPLGTRPFDLSTCVYPSKVTCKRCQRALRKGVLTLDPETGATVLWKLED